MNATAAAASQTPDWVRDWMPRPTKVRIGNGPIREVSSVELMNAYATNTRVGVQSHKQRAWVEGIVTGVITERGWDGEDHPTHFMVTLLIGWVGGLECSGFTESIFIRTH